MAKRRFPLSVPLVASDGFSSTFKGLKREINSMQNLSGPKLFLSGVATSLRGVLGLGTKLAAFAGIGGGGIAGGILGAGLNVARRGDEIAKVAQRIGLGAEALQEYRFAAKQSGVEQATLDMAFQRASRRIGEAQQGFGEARGTLADMGIQVRTTDNRLRSFEEILPEVFKGLASTSDETVRLARAAKLFDSEGAKLVQMLANGAEGVDELRKQFRALGGSIDEEGTAASTEFVDALGKVKVASTGLLNQAILPLLPVLSELTDRTTAWVVKNQPLIKDFAMRFAEGLPQKIELLISKGEVLGTKICAIAARGLELVESLGGVETVAKSIAVIFGLQVAGGLAKTAIGIGKTVVEVGGWIGKTNLLKSALGFLMKGSVLGPIGLITGALFLLEEKTGLVSKTFKLLWEGIVVGAGWVWDKLLALGGFVADLFGGGDDRTASATRTGGRINPNALAQATDRAFEATAGARNREVSLRVEIGNAPPGTRVYEESRSSVPLDVSVGTAFAGV